MRRAIPSHPGYEADDDGTIWSFKAAPRQLRLSAGADGYLRFVSSQSGVRKTVAVHVAVAEAFHGPRPAGLHVLHWNGKPFDNRPTNLRYGTRSDNMLDSVRLGTHHHASKTECSHGHPYTTESVYMYRGNRYCRVCNLDAVRRTKRRKADA